MPAQRLQQQLQCRLCSSPTSEDASASLNWQLQQQPLQAQFQSLTLLLLRLLQLLQRQLLVPQPHQQMLLYSTHQM